MLKKNLTRAVLAILIVEMLALGLSGQTARACSLVGDVNGDGKVNMDDIMLATAAFGSFPGHPRWDSRCDVDGNGAVNTHDLWLIASHFGDTLEKVLRVKVFICPEALNLKSRGRCITAYIKMPEGYGPFDIEPSSIMLNGTIPGLLKFGFIDFEHNVSMAIVKFGRQAVIDLILNEYDMPCRFGRVTFTVTGTMKDGAAFRGRDTIKVIRSHC